MISSDTKFGEVSALCLLFILKRRNNEKDTTQKDAASPNQL